MLDAGGLILPAPGTPADAIPLDKIILVTYTPAEDTTGTYFEPVTRPHFILLHMTEKHLWDAWNEVIDADTEIADIEVDAYVWDAIESSIQVREFDNDRERQIAVQTIYDLVDRDSYEFITVDAWATFLNKMNEQ